MDTRSNLEKLPSKLILEIIKTLSVKEVLNLSLSNKFFYQLIINKETIQSYCQKNNILLVLPKENVNLISALEGQYSSVKAEQVGKELQVTKKALAQKIQENTQTVLSLTPDSLNAFDECEKDEEEIKRLKAIKSDNERKYSALVQKVLAGKNFVDIFKLLYNDLFPVSLLKFDACTIKFKNTKLKLEELKASYGEIVDLFLIYLYCEYVSQLLNTIELRYENAKTNPFSLFVFKATNFYKIENDCKNESKLILDDAEKMLVELAQLDSKKITIDSLWVALKLFKTDDSIKNQKQLLDYFSKKINSIKKELGVNHQEYSHRII